MLTTIIIIEISLIGNPCLFDAALARDRRVRKLMNG
jgi:hypothetical protein